MPSITMERPTTATRNLTDSEIGLWWYRTPRASSNFGDELTKEILHRLGYKTNAYPISIAEADMVGIGSILEMIQGLGKPGLVVWGSGKMYDTQTTLDPRYDYRAVRGRLTEAHVPFSASPILGDPAMLVPLLWGQEKLPTKWGISVIPHYVDTTDYSFADHIIDVRDSINNVITEIRQSATIMSSSLHGYIVATAYGIPALRLHHDKVLGGNYKWMDFFSGNPTYTDSLAEKLIDVLV